jgi:hypothetical protein
VYPLLMVWCSRPLHYSTVPDATPSRSINRDADVYGLDGDDFRPERHLDEKGRLKDETNEGHVSYGFGQRSVAFVLALNQPYSQN